MTLFRSERKNSGKSNRRLVQIGPKTYKTITGIITLLSYIFPGLWITLPLHLNWIQNTKPHIPIFSSYTKIRLMQNPSFSLMFLGKGKSITSEPISSQCYHVIPSEKTKKRFQRFSGIFVGYKMETLARHVPVNWPSFKHDFLSSSKSRKIYQYLAYATSNHGWVIINTLKNSLFSSYPGIRNISLYEHRSWKSEINVRE